VGVQVFYGIFETVAAMQMFVLGPRLVMSIRGYHAKLVAESDTGTFMATIAFQESLLMSTRV
jgi:hypothetical protein